MARRLDFALVMVWLLLGAHNLCMAVLVGPTIFRIVIGVSALVFSFIEYLSWVDACEKARRIDAIIKECDFDGCDCYGPYNNEQEDLG